MIITHSVDTRYDLSSKLIVVVALMVSALASVSFTTPARADLVRQESIAPALPLTRDERAKIELETEILFRCMLYYEGLHSIQVRMLWIELLSLTVMTDRLPDVERRVQLDILKERIRAALEESERYQVDDAALRALIALPYEAFDFVRSLQEMERILLSLEEVTRGILDYTKANERRLQSENPAAMRARIPMDCPSNSP